MMQTRTVFFGHFLYAPDLTYEELLHREETLKASLRGILSEAGTKDLFFEAEGDILRVRCGLGSEGEEIFHSICMKIAPFMQNGLAGRLLFVDKDLHAMHVYSLHNGRWQEALIALPTPGCLEEHPPAVPVRNARSATKKSAS